MSDVEFDDEISNFSGDDDSFVDMNKSKFTKKNKKNNKDDDIEAEQDEEGSESEEEEDDDLEEDNSEMSDDDISEFDDDDLNSDILEELSDFEDDEDELPSKKNKNKQTNKQNAKTNNKIVQNVKDIDYDSDASDDSDEENYKNNGFLSGNKYLKKFSEVIVNDFIAEHHPECVKINSAEAEAMSVIVRNSDGFIIDPKHKSSPILTKYELTSVLGIRTSQLASNPVSFLPKDKLPENLIDPFAIAKLEFSMGVLPFLIKRPFGNNTFEIWKLSDLKVLSDLMLNLEMASKISDISKQKQPKQPTSQMMSKK